MGEWAPLWKPEPRKKIKARKDRAEAEVKKRNRAIVAERDGYCRLGTRAARAVFGDCQGFSEWNHLWKRSRSRNVDSEERHATGVTAMHCQRHHYDVDHYVIKFEYKTERRADGPMRWWKGDAVYEE